MSPKLRLGDIIKYIVPIQKKLLRSVNLGHGHCNRAAVSRNRYRHKILLHLLILYEYQQFFQHRICFSIQPQLQLEIGDISS
jgi:hypothetical protein